MSGETNDGPLPVQGDQELLSAARSGDARALENLIERHQRQVYRFGLKFCGNEDDARDVLQETLLALAKSVRNFEGRASLSTWLYTVARSFCIKHRRRPKHAPSTREPWTEDRRPPETAQRPDPRPDEDLARKEMQAALDSAIRNIEPDFREVLLLRDVEGLSAKETAEVLGITVAAVKSRLHRARRALRDELRPLLGVSEPEPSSRTCPDVLTLYSQHLEGEIDATLCAQLERHIAECPRCNAKCDSLKDTLAMCKAIPAPEVPKDVQDSVRRAWNKLLA